MMPAAACGAASRVNARRGIGGRDDPPAAPTPCSTWPSAVGDANVCMPPTPGAAAVAAGPSRNGSGVLPAGARWWIGMDAMEGDMSAEPPSSPAQAIAAAGGDIAGIGPPATIDMLRPLPAAAGGDISATGVIAAALYAASGMDCGVPKHCSPGILVAADEVGTSPPAGLSSTVGPAHAAGGSKLVGPVVAEAAPPAALATLSWRGCGARASSDGVTPAGRGAVPSAAGTPAGGRSLVGCAAAAAALPLHGPPAPSESSAQLAQVEDAAPATRAATRAGSNGRAEEPRPLPRAFLGHHTARVRSSPTRGSAMVRHRTSTSAPATCVTCCTTSPSSCRTRSPGMGPALPSSRRSQLPLRSSASVGSTERSLPCASLHRPADWLSLRMDRSCSVAALVSGCS